LNTHISNTHRKKESVPVAGEEVKVVRKRGKGRKKKVMDEVSVPDAEAEVEEAPRRTRSTRSSTGQMRQN
jgi:hypothetical protein